MFDTILNLSFITHATSEYTVDVVSTMQERHNSFAIAKQVDPSLKLLLLVLVLGRTGP